MDIIIKHRLVGSNKKALIKAFEKEIISYCKETNTPIPCFKYVYDKKGNYIATAFYT